MIIRILCTGNRISDVITYKISSCIVSRVYRKPLLEGIVSYNGHQGSKIISPYQYHLYAQTNNVEQVIYYNQRGGNESVSQMTMHANELSVDGRICQKQPTGILLLSNKPSASGPTCYNITCIR